MNKHFVILEDGTKATRNSENRTYTHAIAVSPLNVDVAIEQFTARINEQEGYKLEAQNDLAAIKEHGVTVSERESFGIVWAEFTVNGKRVHLNSVHKAGTITAEEATAKAIARLEANIATYTQRVDYLFEDMATAKEQGQWGHWDIVTWCGRHDLAVKQLAKWSDRRGVTAKIVEVERVGA